MPKLKTKPADTLHKPSGQARVRSDGTDHYLGEWGTHEFRDRDDDLITEWLAKQNTTSLRLTVDDHRTLARHDQCSFRRA
jgi:hypothetical protein